MYWQKWTADLWYYWSMQKTKYWGEGGYLVTMDTEKGFDSLDHDVLVTVLKKFCFGSNFISWIKLLLNSEQSSVINGSNSTPETWCSWQFYEM